MSPKELSFADISGESEMLDGGMRKDRIFIIVSQKCDKLRKSQKPPLPQSRFSQLFFHSRTTRRPSRIPAEPAHLSAPPPQSALLPARTSLVSIRTARTDAR